MQKTKKAAKKRFVVTSSGKLFHKGGLSSHLKQHKSARRLRSQKEPKQVIGAEEKMVNRLLGR